MEKVATLPAAERQQAVAAGLLNTKRFDAEQTVNQIEHIYKKILLSELAP